MGSNESSGIEPITDWAGQLQKPERFESAARYLWEKYHRLIEAKIAVQIADELRGKLSPESVAQEAFLSFFRRQAVGEFSIKDRGGLVALLSRIALNKLIGKVRHHSADKRTPGAGLPHGGTQSEEDNDISLADSSPAAHQPATSAEIEAGKKLVYPEKTKREYRAEHPIEPQLPADSEHLAAELDLLLREAEPHVRAAAAEAAGKLDDNLRPVFLLYIQNFTNGEIARQLDIEPGAVRRRIDIIRDRWRELYGDET